MFRKPTACRRLTLVVLLMCALICAQAFSQASESFHQHSSSQHCCALCHAGPMPFLKTAAATTPAPMVALAWLAGSYDPGAAREVLLSAGDSRAPPA